MHSLSVWPAVIPIDEVHLETRRGSRRISVLRLDTIHPLTGGNKWFKLKENLEQFYSGNYSAILSFGGAFSNHIAALADAGHQLGIPVIGIIRGEESAAQNPTLSRARAAGMKLVFVSRESYRRYRYPAEWSVLYEEFGDVLIVPEGGSNAAGVEGCKSIAGCIPEQFTDIALAVGTGATLTGLALGLKGRSKVMGLKVLEAKQENFIFSYPGISELPDGSLYLENRFTMGGYAVIHPDIEQFVNQWNKRYAIPIEPIYTGRLFYGIKALFEEGFFSEKSEVLVIHTGGRQYLDH
jgi:1-aminocyclopropane-1-carboxylate deaminase